MKNHKLILISACLCMFTLTMSAQRSGKRGGNRGQQMQSVNPVKIIEALDTNDDKKIDREEAAKAQRGNLAQNFDKIDTNEDGFIDLEELQNGGRGRKREQPKLPTVDEIFKEADNNQDGKLDRLEIAAKSIRFLEDHFEEIDTNNDDTIDRGELEAHYEVINDKGRSNKRKKKKN